MKKVLIILLIFIIIVFLLNYDCDREDFTPVEALTKFNDIKSTVELTKKVDSIFRKHKITYWMIGGTLLGAVRNKGMISWDDDADIAILDNMEQKLNSIKDELSSEGLGLVPAFFGYKIFNLNGRVIKEYDFKYPFLDVFVTVRDKDKIILRDQGARDSWPKEIYDYNKTFPLKEWEYEDFKLWGPNDPIPLLDTIYTDWKTKGVKPKFEHTTHDSGEYYEFELLPSSNKPYIWLYWDNVNTNKTPDYIILCRETVKKNCSQNFNIIELNKDNIDKWLPELKDFKKSIDPLIIAHKVDIYRIMLLYKYGGIYLDSDIIVMKDLSDIVHKLKKYDFVGFGCSFEECKNGYGKPSNWLLASRPNTRLMGMILKYQLEKIKNKIEYHDIGKNAIWHVMDQLIKEEDYQYYQYDCTYDGTRDINGKWITSDMVFSNKTIEYDNERNFLVYVFYNTGMDDNIKKMTRNELLNKKWNFTKYLKKSLKLN